MSIESVKKKSVLILELTSSILGLTVEYIAAWFDDVKSIVKPSKDLGFNPYASMAAGTLDPLLEGEEASKELMVEAQNRMDELLSSDYEDDGDYESDRVVYMANESGDVLPVRFSGEEWKMLHEISTESGEDVERVIEDVVAKRIELANNIYREDGDDQDLPF
jgi:hypothetical protein